eukprot:3505396-Pleurochrysis_carterae.AAC.3
MGKALLKGRRRACSPASAGQLGVLALRCRTMAHELEVYMFCVPQQRQMPMKLGDLETVAALRAAAAASRRLSAAGQIWGSALICDIASYPAVTECSGYKGIHVAMRKPVRGKSVNEPQVTAAQQALFVASICSEKVQSLSLSDMQKTIVKLGLQREFLADPAQILQRLMLVLFFNTPQPTLKTRCVDYHQKAPGTTHSSFGR